MALEIELKYSSPSGRVPPTAELAAALSSMELSVAEVGVITQDDLYLDTPASELQAAGYALRIRSTAGARQLTLKARGSAVAGLHEREELNAEVGVSEPPPWPLELISRLEQVAAAVELEVVQPQIEITTQRHLFTVSSAQGQVAELAFDQVTCRPASVAQPTTGVSEALFNEVEIEATRPLVEGPQATGELLRAVGAALVSLLPLQLSDVSKLERASALLAPFT